jgi:hypothetical protein
MKATNLRNGGDPVWHTRDGRISAEGFVFPKPEPTRLSSLSFFQNKILEHFYVTARQISEVKIFVLSYG